MNPWKNSNGDFDSAYIIGLIKDSDVITVKRRNLTAKGHWYDDAVLNLMVPTSGKVFGSFDWNTMTFTVRA